MKLNYLLKTLGPGLLWAGAAIGVSHLVQSTRAGATYGFDLVFLILLINLFKYPFFEYGPRYAAATGESLLHGYRRLGKWGIYMYMGLTIATMFTLQGAVTVVTAGIFSSVFPGIFDIFTWVIVILLSGTAIVAIGKYSLLDRLIKFIIILLAISAIVAVAFAASKGFHPQPEFAKDFEWSFADIALLIAIAGWMPSAVDISVWHSFWTIAKSETSGIKPKLKESLFDFNVGYIGTAILSIGFLSLGALVMYGTGETFSPKGSEFAGQLISLFTSNIGQWSYPLIAIAALATMSSTTLTCLDAYPRVMKPATELIFDKKEEATNKKWLAYLWLTILIVGTVILLKYFASNMAFMVDLATTLSFITAPVIGYMNFKAVTSSHVAPENQPPYWLRVLTWIGLIVLSGVAVYYLIWKFFVA